MLRHYGVTLIEMLVALVVGSLVLASLISFYVFIAQHSKRSLEITRLDQELYLAMDVMSHDVRRAGYWANAQNDIGTGTLTNPFMQTDTDLQVSSSNDCILFSYDKNSDGTLPALGAANDERYGFRLSGNVIQYRIVSGSFACDSASGWEDLTDPNIINVTNLSFTVNTDRLSLGGGDFLDKRNVTISLTASLTNDANITRTLSRQITVRNSKFISGS